MADLSRRDLIQAAVVAGVGLYATAADAAPATQPAATRPAGSPELSTWLDTKPNGGAAVGTTWGVPWPRGSLKANASLRVEAADGTPVPAQTWTTAFWPDGSVKWSAVAVGPNGNRGDGFRVTPGTPAEATGVVSVKQDGKQVTIDTGVLQCTLGTSGMWLLSEVRRNGRPTLTNGRLVAISTTETDHDAQTVGAVAQTQRITSLGGANAVTVEQNGPVRAVVKITGRHKVGEIDWLPFVVRLYFYAGSDAIRVVHSFVYDRESKIGDNKLAVGGIGLAFDVPMTDELHNRHVRFVGQDHGLFYEAVRTITGLRRDPGAKARAAQVAGKATASSEWATTVSNRIDYIPAWGDFTLSQLSADGFRIKKRTAAGCGWIAAAAGKRAAGTGYIGGAAGGVSFGIRDFWEKHPAQLDIRNAHTDTAAVTLWLWSPEAGPMDMRPYHGPAGFDTYDKQIEGLNITYEDYEPGYDTPYGIARTSEMMLRVEAATPAAESLVQFADAVRKPPTLMASPRRILDSGVFGGVWTLPDTSTTTKAWIENRLTKQLDTYLTEIEQRSWYGFWDYGDVMHSYDEDRHQWKYDVGGFAWDNSELSTDLWLWMSVLRTGRADVFRMAEAMTRHTGEVDVYHIGRFRGLGTRHGVQHWSDSSKQSRISTPIYRRMFYYLTADERVGDLLREQLHTIEAEKKIVITRKLKPGSPTLPLPAIEDGPPGGEVELGGLNFGNAMAGWVTEAERTGDAAWTKKITEAMRSFAELPHGFFSTGWTMNIDTGHVTPGGDDITLSHLMACFGLPEIVAELVNLYGDAAPKFAETWAQYGRLYGGTDEQRKAELTTAYRQGMFKEASLRDAHSRATAFAAKLAKDTKLADRAKAELLGNKFTPDAPGFVTKKLVGPAVLTPVEETLPTGTNGAAQWGLAAMQCLSFVGEVFE